MPIRLIDADTLKLKLFHFGADTPPYAILSHTWHGTDDEVTFPEMAEIGAYTEHPATKKLGYDKIVKACAQAKASGLSYAWVDTCCIDKSSSAELSEAINSMFSWYAQAAVCFVYLADFPDGTEPSVASLSGCKWFTRGWCLQELLAPSKVILLGNKWGFIGDKEELRTIISQITLITEDALAMPAFKLRRLPVALRLSWAARRQTTRDEDMAYCLLGIFDVNMPMLYGEGYRKAFARLQEEIAKESNDLSIFAFPALNFEGGDFVSLIARHPRQFTGCEHLENTNRAVSWNTSFDLTNKGIYLRKAELYVDGVHGIYIMPLHCKVPSQKPKRLYLSKVGPGLYYRVNESKLSESIHAHDAMDAWGRGDSYTRLYEEVYIINRYDSSVLGAELGSIRIRSQTHNLFHALQPFQRAPMNQSRWDASRMQFLTRGERNFRGCWKLFPHLAKERKPSSSDAHDGEPPALANLRQQMGLVDFADVLGSSPPSSPLGPRSSQSSAVSDGYVYLVCGIDNNHTDNHHDDGHNALAGTDPTITNAATKAWVRLYYRSEWEAMQERAGMMANSFALTEIINSGSTHETATVGIGADMMTVDATIDRVQAKDGHDEHYTLSLNLTKLGF